MKMDLLIRPGDEELDCTIRDRPNSIDVLLVYQMRLLSLRIVNTNIEQILN